MKRNVFFQLLSIIFLFGFLISCSSEKKKSIEITEEKMREIFQEIKTPYKYGLLMVPGDTSHQFDCPSVFKKDDQWYMTYIVYDGKGYETWLAKSDDLLNWDTLGELMSFSKDTTEWDAQQKAGYIALQDPTWGGSYEWTSYDDKYWMSYFGSNSTGYEAGLLSIGMAYSDELPTQPTELKRLEEPVLMPTDEDARWYDNSVMYKSSIIRDKERETGHEFVMYYNARGDSINPGRGAERIAMAVSNDMKNWKRYGNEPLINHHTGISGDAFIQRINDTWVMFYFGAFWKEGAFNRFAVSNDLINWTDWEGEDLIAPSEVYDEAFAHKSFVVKDDGIVYHFYCAVNKEFQRGIAVATSKDLGKSDLRFVEKKKDEK